MGQIAERAGCASPDDCHLDVTIADSTLMLSDEGRKIFAYVNFVAICCCTALFGIIANIINIIIFYKQGFTNTVNISFLGLAVSDLCCMIALEWSSICLNPFLPVYDVRWIALDVMYLSGGWPHVCFCRITSYITVYITAERFISIAWPLKVKQIVTATRTTTIICLIYFVNIMTLVPEYATSYLGWKFVPATNKSLVGINFTSSREDVEGLCYVMHAIFSVTSFSAVILFTFFLVHKLRQSSQCRRKIVSSQDQKAYTASKERKTVKMIVFIASVLIVCNIPGAMTAMAMFILGADFNVQGRYARICEAAWSVACTFQSINSSVNIFLYYMMSSKYRHTFDEMFGTYFARCRNSKLFLS